MRGERCGFTAASEWRQLVAATSLGARGGSPIGNIYDTNGVTEIREFQTDEGDAPFADWFDGLSDRGTNRVMIALGRMRQGNLGDHKGVGRGLFEHRVHDGPGYRIDFGKDGKKLIILLGGGTKKRQQRDIDAAQRHWKRYKDDTKRRMK